MPKRNSLLFATDVFPYPLDRGQHVRIYNLIVACSRACDLTLVVPAPIQDTSRTAIEGLDARVVYLEAPASGRIERAANILHTARLAPGIPSPRTIRHYESFVSTLRKVQPETFDIVWAERPHIGRLCGDYHARAIMDLDDVEHIKVLRERTLLTAPIERLRSAYRYQFYRHIELSWSRRFLATVVCSETDRQYMAKHGCDNVIVVPNAPNLSDCLEQTPSRRFMTDMPLRLLFLGNVTSVPNADAIAYFADDILTLLRKEFPDTTLDVIGPGASEAVQQKYESRVNFRGFVPDLREALANYDMLVAPLRFGSGTKLKVLDAMAHGLPVVTTAVGAEGLDLVHGQTALLAETPAEFVSCILRLKRDTDLVAQLSTAANQLVRDRFSWQVIQDNLVSFLESVRT